MAKETSDKTAKKRERKRNEEKVIFSWKIQEYDDLSFFKKYKVILIILAGVLGLWALYNSNYLLTLISVLMIFLFVYFANYQFKKFKVDITESGIYVDEDFYPFVDFQYFWVSPKSYKKKKFFGFRFDPRVKKHDLKIPVASKDAETIRLFINQYVPQTVAQDDVLDIFDNLFR